MSWTRTFVAAVMLVLVGCGGGGEAESFATRERARLEVEFGTLKPALQKLACGSTVLMPAETPDPDSSSTASCELPNGAQLVFFLADEGEDTLQVVADSMSVPRCLTQEHQREGLHEVAANLWMGYLKSVSVTLDKWMIDVPRATATYVAETLDGQVFTFDGDYPRGYEPVPIKGCSRADWEHPPFTPRPAARSDASPSPQPPTQSSGSEDCMDNCEVTAEKLIADLDLIVCDPYDPAADLADDVTSQDPYGLAADRILGCTAGGSISLASLGLVHIYNSYDQMLAGAVRKLKQCEGPGVSAYGGIPGGLGYAVVGIERIERSVLQGLEAGGAKLLCA